MRRSRIALTLALGAATLAAPVAAADVPPPCTFGDEIVAYEGDAWADIVLDTQLSLPHAYAPNDLVPVRRAGVGGRGKVRAFVIDDLAALAAAARSAGVSLKVHSAYRTYRTQASTFRAWIRKIGLDRAMKTSARPGHSEHQLGTAIDFTTPGSPLPWNIFDSWARGTTARWLAANAWRYGFVLSYPKGAYQSTCYEYEPWHYRYVGREMAQAISDSGEPLRVWLMTHVVPSPTPEPTATPEPTSTPEPTPTPESTSTAAPTVTPEPTAPPTAEPTVAPEPTAQPTAESTAGAGAL